MLKMMAEEDRLELKSQIRGKQKGFLIFLVFLLCLEGKQVMGCSVRQNNCRSLGLQLLLLQKNTLK